MVLSTYLDDPYCMPTETIVPTTTYTILYEEDDCEEYYDIEEKEWCKVGWYNPRKIALPKQYPIKKVLIRIRNML